MSGGRVLLIGCGRLGSAILEGWMKTGAVALGDLTLLARTLPPAAEAARGAGARINPPLDELGLIDSVVLAVKPAAWRAAVEPLTGRLAPGTALISVMAGVKASAIAEVLPDVAVARVMPTTGVAAGRGVAALWSADKTARACALSLFQPIAGTVELEDEVLLDAATATAGSAPAYVFAFVRALARAGEAAGLPAHAAMRLARGALASAAASLEADETLETLIARVALPGGTTEAGLQALAADDGLDRLMQSAVSAAQARARALG